jgi:hypothetical protein
MEHLEREEEEEERRKDQKARMNQQKLRQDMDKPLSRPSALKGQCHEIFDFRFFHESVSPKSLSIPKGTL